MASTILLCSPRLNTQLPMGQSQFPIATLRLIIVKGKCGSYWEPNLLVCLNKCYYYGLLLLLSYAKRNILRLGGIPI